MDTNIIIYVIPSTVIFIPDGKEYNYDQSTRMYGNRFHMRYYEEHYEEFKPLESNRFYRIN